MINNKRLLTENDVYKSNRELVREVCRNYGKIIEHEDRKAIANIGMIYAIRTYKRGISPFDLFAVDYMRELLCIAEDNQRRVRRVEHPLSLDMRLKSGESLTTYVEVFAHPNNDFISSITTCDFIKHLEKKLQYVACLYINNYSTKEIAEATHIPVIEVERLKMVLCYKWKEYDK